MNTIPFAVRQFVSGIAQENIIDWSHIARNLLAQFTEATPAPKITAETPIDYSNDAIREHAELLVRQNVNYCVSSLVSSLCKLTGEGRALAALDISDDEIYSITSQSDWKTPVTEYLQSADAETVADVVEYFPGVDQDGFPDASTALIAHLEETDAWQECADYCGIDPDTVEAYEHWIVDSWFARELESHGEMIARDFLGLTIWGRTTTGQSISMDHVVLTIARDALI